MNEFIKFLKKASKIMLIASLAIGVLTPAAVLGYLGIKKVYNYVSNRNTSLAYNDALLIDSEPHVNDNHLLRECEGQNDLEEKKQQNTSPKHDHASSVPVFTYEAKPSIIPVSHQRSNYQFFGPQSTQANESTQAEETHQLAQNM